MSSRFHFSPGIYEHAAALIERTPWEVSRDGALLAEAHRMAWECYRHPLVVAGIDIYNLEAEAYGAVIQKPQRHNVPAISTHPFTEIRELNTLAPLRPEKHPRIQSVLEAAALLCRNCPDAAVRVPVCGPFALAIGLIGFENLLIALAEDPDEVFRTLKHLLEGQALYLDAIRSAGVKPIFFESGTTPPLLPAHLFEMVESPLLRSLFDEAEIRFGERPPCIIGGNATPIAAAFFNAKPGYVIAPSETDQREFLQIAVAHPEVHVRINMNSTRLAGSDFCPIKVEAERVLALATTRSNVSIGCGVVPYEADPETICRLRDFVETHPATVGNQ